MGTEFSRAVVDKPRSLSAIQFGVQYTAVDTSVWPHLIPLAQWFMPEDARAIHRRLRARTVPSLLSFREFVELLASSSDAPVWPRQRPQEDDTAALRTSSSKSHPCDLSTKVPVSLSAGPEPRPLVMELYLQHVFHTFKPPNARTERVYGLEFLAAMVVMSRAIWLLDDKVRLLAELFLDPASSSTTGAAMPVVKLKETDVALLILCVMRGIAKATVGIALVWGKHLVDVVAVAKKLAADCFQYVMDSREDTGDTRTTADFRRAAATVNQQEFVSYVRQKPVIRNFLARFSAGELRNPSTFASSTLPETGYAVDGSYRTVLTSQARLYDALVQQHVSLEGRREKRESSAALLIQSTWRRRCSKLVIQQEIQAQENQRNASASVLQSFAKNLHAFKQLKLAADVERDAFNGGVFVAGSGPCLGSAACDGYINSREARRQSLNLMEAFKTSRLSARIAAMDMSPTFALALDEDGRSLYAWGKCLPREYVAEDDATSSQYCLFSAQPRRLAFQFAQGRVASLACGLRHALALMDDGMVFSWGFNDHGQLGHGPASVLAARSGGGDAYRLYYDELTGREQEYLATPTKLLYFRGSDEQLAEPIPIAQVACGDYYCVALSRDGDVFTWGEASEGQLGHGDAHSAFQVGLVDRYMTNSAFTFLSEPEPMLALSDTRIVQVACQRNHVMALSDDSRLFEWGNWGKRRDTDMEHAFAPVERLDTQELRLRRIAVGDHHALAEGASAWMTVAIPDEQPDQPESLHTGPLHEAACYVEVLPGFSLDALEQHFIITNGIDASNEQRGLLTTWTCHFAEIDFDNVEESETERMDTPDNSSSRSIWHRRTEKMALSTVQDVARFDPKIRALVQLGAFPCELDAQNQPRAPGEAYSRVVRDCLGDRVRGRFVVYPRGKQAGHYIQFLLPSLPTESTSAIRNGEARSEELEPSTSSPQQRTTVEFLVRGSNTTRGTITPRGFATHVYHPSMAEEARRLKQQQLRQKRRPTSQPTEINELFVLEVNEQLLGSWADAGDHEGSLEEAADMDAEMIGSEITRRVLELQESGVIAVLVVLDLFDADAFELNFAPESGIYIPVLMLDVKTRGYVIESHSMGSLGEYPSDTQPWWSVYDVLAQLEATQRRSPSSFAATRPHSAVELPPPLLARCFLREDTALARIEAAFSLGAASVLFARNPRDATTDVNAHSSVDALFWSSPTLAVAYEQQFIGLLQHEHAMQLRSASWTEHANTGAGQLTTPPTTPDNFGSIVDVRFEIRPGGTTHAWGVAQNGRLGLGSDLGSNVIDGGELFLDGYEALTDSAYRYVSAPTQIPALEGIEMKQLACGSAHSLALTVDGKVFSWGRGSRGELALSRTTEGCVDLWEPQPVHGLQFESITQLAANDQCSMFLTEVLSQDLYMERRRQIAHLKAAAKRKSSLLDEEGGQGSRHS